MSSSHRDFKDRLYAQFARVGKALASPHRIEILELLAQAERTVDSLATEVGLSLANTSQHLQALRQAALVESRKEGLFVYYRLADPAVFELCAATRRVAECRLADLERLLNDHFGDRAQAEPIEMTDLLERLHSPDVIVLDARPANEYQAGHIAGAISVPIDELQEHLRSLPRDKDYVAYCRGPYCVYADRAVKLLTKNRRRARRLTGGLPEWRAAGFPTSQGDVLPRRATRPRSGRRRPQRPVSMDR
jgi:DNA-binding transcriptional ArsR family regulator/rhodanese-related sulfurtransferase